MTVLGAVLTGGRSSRMGRDKAVLAVDGVPMALRSAAALAGCDRVVAVGGDVATLTRLGLEVVADPRQGSGPLGGLLTALELANGLGVDIAVVTACDLPDLRSEVASSLVDALRSDDTVAVAVARTDRPEPLCAAWRVEQALPVAQEVFASGRRAVRALFDLVGVAEVPVESALLRNVNRPEDLAGR